MKNIMTLFVIFSCMQIRAQHISNSEKAVFNALIQSQINKDSNNVCINSYSIRKYLNLNDKCNDMIVIKQLENILNTDSLRYDFYIRINYYFNNNKYLIKKHFTFKQIDEKDILNFVDSLSIFNHNSVAIEHINNTNYNKYINNEFSNDIFICAEVSPTYPLGIDSLMDFIRIQLVYPEETEIEGRVLIRFVIEKDGTVSNVNCLKGISTNFNDEAMRVVKMLQQWTPAYVNNNKVRLYYHMPIRFTK